MNSAEGISIVINAIHELCGVGICYYDLNSFFNYNIDGNKNNRGHYCEFCKRVRGLPNGKVNCEKSDKLEAVELAKQYKEPFFFECHMGMKELVVPLHRDDVLLGIIFVGQCRLDNDYESKIRANAEKMQGNPDDFLHLYNMLPLLSQKNLMNIGNILIQYFDTKILNSEFISPKVNPAPILNDISKTVKQYIQSNYRFSLSLKEIAKSLHLNPSYISRCFSEKAGMTVTEYISFVRLKRAKELLLTTDAPIGNIALNVGFEDINYFSRVFRKKEGCSPLQYRKNR